MKRFCILAICFVMGCAAQSAPPTAARVASATNVASPSVTPTSNVFATATTAPARMPTVSNDPVLVGAGDIAVCESKGDEATAQLVEKTDGIVFTLGDNVYPGGSAEQFQKCYEPTWGKFKARTYPIPGNHDYAAAGAKPYYAYFGARAGEPGKGYYSFDVGAWHIVALNSEIETDENSAQVRWLRADLAQHPAECTLAMFHRPLFSSGPHGRDGSGEKTRALWNVLYENNADVILNGHDHDYERFAPQDPNGERDDARGLREIVVGTGGAVFYPISETIANSEAHRSGVWGVLKLTLHASSYDWEFVPMTRLLFHDSGHGACH